MESKQNDTIIRAIYTAYTTGRFDVLFPLMTDDYEHISFWVTEVLRGKKKAQEYYAGKGETLRKSRNYARGVLVRILSAPDRVRPRGVFKNGTQVLEDAAFLHRNDAGKTAVLLGQMVNGEIIRTLVVPTITEDGKLRQLLITEPKLFRLERIESDE